MESKRRSSRVGHAVNYNEDSMRRVIDEKGKAVRREVEEEPEESESEHEEEERALSANKGKQKVGTKRAGRPAGDDGYDGRDEREDDGDLPGTSAGRKRQRVAAPTANVDVKDLSLFEVVWKQGNAIPYVARQWVERYRENRAEATAEVLTLLLQAGGCDDNVKGDDVEDDAADDLIGAFQAKVIKEGATDPFHKASASFQSNYMKMWDKVVNEANNAELLQDCYVMEKISRFVIAMSLSVVRPFRFAATLTASQLVGSWVHTLLSLSDAQNTANQQLEAEQRKKSNKVVQERMDALTKAVEKKRRAVSEVQVLVNNLMDAVFAHRFRDVDMDIRSLVIQGIASWIHLHPSMFLADQYLKYVAWGLSDKDKVVRIASVDGLLKLYAVEANVLPLREFTKRFTNRFLELPYDVDIQVAVRGAKLLDRLVAVKQLDTTHVKKLYRMLAGDSPELRHAVSDLVVRLLDNSTATVDAPQADAKGKGKRPAPAHADPNKAQKQLLGLLSIMTQLAEPIAPTPPGSAVAGPSTSAAAGHHQSKPLDQTIVLGLVDALYAKLPVLQDWNALCAALLDDRLATLRGPVGDANLARLLRASVRLKTEKAGGKKKGRGARGAQDADAMSSTTQTMSLVLMQQLPRLLAKFPTEGQVVTSLVDVITDMQLDVYSLKQQEKDLEALTRLISDLLLKHSDKEALTAAASTLLHLADKAPTSLQDVTQLVLSETVDQAASKLAAAYRAAKAVSDEELEDAVEEASQGGQGNSQLFNLHSALLRINVLEGQGCSSLASHSEVASTLMSILQEAGHGRNYGAGVIGSAAFAVLTSLLWGLRSVVTDSSSEEGMDNNPARVQDLLSKRNEALDCLADALKAIEDQAVRDVMLTVTMDLVLLFGSRQKWHGTPLGTADLDVPDRLMRPCWEHLLDILDRNPSPDKEADGDDPEEESQDAGAVLANEATRAKVEAVAGVGRLLAFNALQETQYKWLGAQYVALMGGHGRAVTEVVKDVCRHMRKSKPALLPDIYLAAMKTSFNAARLTAADSEEDHAAAIQDFSRLCAAIASTYAGHNISKGALLHICEGGVQFALESVPQNLPFLEWGLKHFTPKLHAEAAQELLEELEDGVGDQERDPREETWSSYTLYTRELKERANRARVAPKGALKQPLNLQPPAHKMGRRISFVGDEQEPNQDQQAGPGVSARKQPAGHEPHGEPSSGDMRSEDVDLSPVSTNPVSNEEDERQAEDHSAGHEHAAQQERKKKEKTLQQGEQSWHADEDRPSGEEQGREEEEEGTPEVEEEGTPEVEEEGTPEVEEEGTPEVEEEGTPEVEEEGTPVVEEEGTPEVEVAPASKGRGKAGKVSGKGRKGARSVVEQEQPTKKSKRPRRGQEEEREGVVEEQAAVGQLEPEEEELSEHVGDEQVEIEEQEGIVEGDEEEEEQGDEEEEEEQGQEGEEDDGQEGTPSSRQEGEEDGQEDTQQEEDDEQAEQQQEQQVKTRGQRYSRVAKASIAIMHSEDKQRGEALGGKRRGRSTKTPSQSTEMQDLPSATEPSASLQASEPSRSLQASEPSRSEQAKARPVRGGRKPAAVSEPSSGLQASEPSSNYGDKAPLDKGPLDKGPLNKGPLNKGPLNKGPIDKGPLNKGPLQKGPLNKGSIDKGPLNKGPLDKGPLHKAQPVHGGRRAVSAAVDSGAGQVGGKVMQAGGQGAARRVTRASLQEAPSSQGLQPQGGKGAGKRRSGGVASGSQGPSSVPESQGTQAGSLDSLAGMMPTEEQLPLASQPPSSMEGSEPPPFNMSDPEALPGHGAAAQKIRRSGRGKVVQQQQQSVPESTEGTEADDGEDAGAHARKRRRRH